MRLSRIKLAGFKSFVDPTTINFTSNLTGIIGPNGCGKSNTIDAVRWVMGESSAKHLRGASMDDVIFKGSSARAPVGKAYVELVFDNSDGTLQGQYAQYNEISIRREVTRDGKSGYYLNGTKCRRRDITDIFLGTGLGPRSYAIIEQGMISRLIEAKPEDMRVYIEEAAGISKYKERRRETENRIRHSRDNLARLDDLREEIDKQITKLERQAKVAEKYKVLKQEERGMQAQLLALKWKELNHAVNNRERFLQDLENQVESEVSKQRAVEAQIEEQRSKQVDANESLGVAQGEWYRIGSEITRAEQNIQHHQQTKLKQNQELEQLQIAWAQANEAIEEDLQRVNELDEKLQTQAPDFETLQAKAEESAERLAEAEAQMQTWQSDWDTFNGEYAQHKQVENIEGARKEQLERALLDLQQRLEKAQTEHNGAAGNPFEQTLLEAQALFDELGQNKDVLSEQMDASKQSYTEQREKNQLLTKDVEEARTQVSKLNGRLSSLEALQQAALAQSDEQINAWLKGNGLQQQPRLAQSLKVEDEWANAVEWVLSQSLHAVCVDDIQQMDARVDALTALKQGQLMLIETPSGGRSSSKNHAQSLESKVSSPYDLSPWLANVRIADGAQPALAMRDDLAEHESVITADGVWLGKHWTQVFKEQSDSHSILHIEQQLAQTASELKQAEQVLEARLESLEAGREALLNLEQQREATQQQWQQSQSEFAQASAEVKSIQSQNAQWMERQRRLNSDIDDLTQKIDAEKDNAKQSQAAWSQAKLALEQLQNQKETLSARKESLQDALNESRFAASQDKEAWQTLNVSLQTMRASKEAADKSLSRMQTQREHMKQRREELLASVEDDDMPIEALQVELESWLSQRIDAEQKVNDARTAHEAIEQQLRDLEQSRLAAEKVAQEKSAQLQQERLNAQENKVRRQTIKENLDETGYAPNQLLESMPENADSQEWEHKLSEVVSRIHRLGAINLAAIDEFSEQSERKQYLDSQHKDLTDALNTLEAAISKIDKETKSRFKETFEQVNKRIGEMFPKLFGGGQAYLELTDDDLLSTGVSIMARPPGKRVSNIHLLSGGEKALTAVAMVFAIFELNPAPFCMLDEVDAPLDEANVGRFCQMVKEMSAHVQFIFITHNKPAMELAQQLHGVTMREAGVSRIVAVDVDEAAQLVDA